MKVKGGARGYYDSQKFPQTLLLEYEYEFEMLLCCSTASLGLVFAYEICQPNQVTLQSSINDFFSSTLSLLHLLHDQSLEL